MCGRQQNSVSLFQQKTRMQLGRWSVGMEKTTRESAGLQCRELGGGGGFVELDAHAGKAAIELAQNSGEDSRHREAGESDSDVPKLAGGQRVEFAGNRSEAA